MGILENLAQVLDLKIQDIVVGEIRQTEETSIDTEQALAADNGVIPLGSEFNKAGPFINLQLTLVFVLNVLFLIAGGYHWVRRDNEIYAGFVVQTAAIYTTALYGDLLHRLDGLSGFLFNLCIRTCVVFAGTAIAVLLMRVLKKK